jgi:hypothetical protein
MCGEGESEDLFREITPIKPSCMYYSNPLTKGGIKSGMASGKMTAEAIINDKPLVWSTYQAVDGC